MKHFFSCSFLPSRNHLTKKREKRKKNQNYRNKEQIAYATSKKKKSREKINHI